MNGWRSPLTRYHRASRSIDLAMTQNPFDQFAKQCLEEFSIAYGIERPSLIQLDHNLSERRYVGENDRTSFQEFDGDLRNSASLNDRDRSVSMRTCFRHRQKH